MVIITKTLLRAQRGTKISAGDFDNKCYLINDQVRINTSLYFSNLIFARRPKFHLIKFY